MTEPANPNSRHFTARRGFTIFVGLLVLTLYFLWAGYGAAPTSLGFLSESRSEGPDGTGGRGGMAMGGHGSGTVAMTPEAFLEITEKFVEDLSLPDESVRPTRQWMMSMAAMGGGAEEQGDESGGHRDEDKGSGHGSSTAGTGDDGKTATEDDRTRATMPMDAAAAAASSIAAMTGAVARQPDEAHGADEEGADEEGADEDASPIDVYLVAMQFSYLPRVLRLKKGVPYRFRMMSIDVNHGASIHTGFAGHIMRRPARKMVEMVMTFPEPGEFMIYCTVFCGAGHSQMKGKIIVE